MPRGNYPYDYLLNPHVSKPLEEVWADLQGYTSEFFKDEPQFYPSIDFWVILPPLWYEGRFIKGLFFSQSVDFLYEMYPELSELFLSIGNSMWCSYPWSNSADAYFASYNNPERDAWFKKTFSEKNRKILIPTQDADCTHEYYIAAVPFLKRDIDVLTVSSLQERKNLPMVAEALKIYREKYGRAIRMTLIIGKNIDLYRKNLIPEESLELQRIETILKDPSDYIDFVPHVDYSAISQYYSRAKVLVLGSLIEGKNRAMNEAMSCDTPVACFQDLNQYTRGEDPLFPEGAGLCAENFYPECLADTIREIIKNQGDFKPRFHYLKTNGRKKFFNTCLKSFHSYYERLVPDFTLNDSNQNIWLDLAIQANYQLSLLDFLYDKNPSLSHTQGLEAIEKTVKFYLSRRDFFASKAK